MCRKIDFGDAHAITSGKLRRRTESWQSMKRYFIYLVHGLLFHKRYDLDYVLLTYVRGISDYSPGDFNNEYTLTGTVS